MLSDILANRPETNLDATTPHSGMRTGIQAAASLSPKQTPLTSSKQNLKILEVMFLGVLPKEIFSATVPTPSQFYRQLFFSSGSVQCT